MSGRAAGAGHSANRIDLDYHPGLDAATGAAFAQAPASPADNSIVLIAGPDSRFAAGIAAELADQHPGIERVEPDALVENLAAAVVVVEHDSELPALRALLARPSTPTLVMAATRRLADAILPLLGNAHDLATAADSPDILRWRLQRLLRQARTPTLAVAELDALTGLLNRRAFEQRLLLAIENHAPGEVTGLLLLDLDQFKPVNDRFGHVAGDRVLRAVAQLLPRSLARGDTVCRLGGDEFGCLLTRADTDSIVRDGEQLLQDIADLALPELSADPLLPRLGASAGLTFVRPSVKAATLLNEADMATYQAKSGGRNRLEIYCELAEAAKQSSRDLDLTHFENVTRVATERLVEMITLKSRRLVDAAKQEANLCPLTGLYSRRYVETQLPREIERVRAQGRPLSIALIDIDHFHTVNMTHGWPTGDRVLQTFATVVQANVRSTDWVARYGGEEFLIVLPNTTLDSARYIIERVRHAFASAGIVGLEGEAVAATLSAGVAQRADATVSAVAFVNQASKALLEAKGTGRNRVVLAD